MSKGSRGAWKGMYDILDYGSWSTQ